MAKGTKVIYGVKTIKREGKEEQDYWTRIGTAFVNNDDSLNLSLDYYPTNSDMTIQIRNSKEKETEA
jgi:hypothetical protein